MDEQTIAQLGDELYDALRTQQTVLPLTERYADITVDDAYHVSLHMVNRRVDAGETIIGKKIGVTSAPVQEMLGVFQPDFGFLTDGMVCADGADIPIAGQLIAPRAEGEIAFRLKADLAGPGVTEQHVLDATGSIMACFEIVDSRIANWQIKIEDTVADNASCGVYVLGTREVDPRDLDLANLAIKVYKNGELNCEGVSCAVQGNPLTAVAWLANTLGEFDIPFTAGEVILSGSLVPLIPVVAGDRMSLQIDGIGGCSCNFV